MQKKNFLLLMILSLSFYYCSCSSCSKKGFEITTPDSIFISAGNFISSKVGGGYYKNNFFPDYIKSKKLANGDYEVHFNFRIIDKPYVDNDVWLITDSLGSVLINKGCFGIPDCIKDPAKCEFNINQSEALNIAERADFEKGIKNWKSAFRWVNDFNGYVWDIISVLEESGDPKSENYKAKGKEIFINPASGDIIEERGWIIN